MDNSWVSIEQCFKDRTGDNITDDSLELIKDIYEHAKIILLANPKIQRKVEYGRGLDVLSLYTGFGYSEAYLLSKLFSNKSGGEITFNRLVVVDRIYHDPDTRHGLDCLLETGLVKEIVYFSNFQELASYFSGDPQNAKFDFLLEIHSQIVIYSNIKTNAYLRALSISRTILETYQHMIESLNYILSNYELNTIPVIKINNCLSDSDFIPFSQYYNTQYQHLSKVENEYRELYDKFDKYL